MRTIFDITFRVGTAGEVMKYGFLVVRLSDIGVNIAGQPVASTVELPWLYLDHVESWAQLTNTAGKAQFRGDIRSRRRLGALNMTYGLCLTNPDGVSALAGTVFVRSLIALP
jgi:hypothetical protein